MPSQLEIRKSITEKIVAALRSGSVPFWRKPWAQSENAGLPTNAVSGKRYQGCNTLLLSLAALEKGYESRFWATYQQWRSLGGQVCRGEKGTQIVLYKPVQRITIDDDGREEVETYPIMRTWSVFNLQQCDGAALDQYRNSVLSIPDTRFMACERAEEAIAATGADIRHGGGRAFYSPEGDFIQLPSKQAFENAAEYYEVAGHELVHWTGHKSRLNRLNKLARFGNETYAVEELVAELGSAFLSAELGIPQSDDLTNVTAYLASWLRVLERDHFAIFTASSAAAKAADLILSFSRRPKAEELVTA